jgi:L-alanine-DL-glutamate epimerase-like enolase superfamily enzyme
VKLEPLGRMFGHRPMLTCGRTMGDLPRLPPIRIVAVESVPLSVPLREPFVIATGRIDETRAALVTATVEERQTGRRAHGLGEAAALPPVTREDQPDLLRAIGAAAPELAGAAIADLAALEARLERALGASAPARAGVACALLDAWAELAGLPLAGLLAAAGSSDSGGDSGGGALLLETDVTLPIAAPAHMANLAAAYRAGGFRIFKVKVGREVGADHAALAAVRAAVPDARLRIDANAGFRADEALALLDRCAADGIPLDCFEQPCAAADLDGMAEVSRGSHVPVVADESFRSGADLERLAAAGAARGVNLKLAKLGSPIAALALGREARRLGLGLMAGAMVETRLGITAMAHVVAALGGVEWLDLDTAFLLAGDPFTGGFVADGPLLTLPPASGLGVRRASG